MAFTPGTLHLSVDTIGGGSLRIHFYETTDNVPTLTVSGYLVSVAQRGVRTGDMIVISIGGGFLLLAGVTVDASGNGTLIFTGSDARDIYLSQFGAREDGSDSQPALLLALNFLNDIGGGTLHIDGSYFLQTGVLLLDWDCSFTITGDGYGELVVDNTFDMVTSTRHLIFLFTDEFADHVFKHDALIKDLTVDAMDAPTEWIPREGGGESGTVGFELNFFKKVTYQNLQMLGGPDDWFPTDTTKHGDTGLAALAENAEAIDCFLQAWADVGYYTNGTDEHNGTAGFRAAAESCYFRRCVNGYSVKRESEFAGCYDSVFDECLNGFQGQTAGADIRGSKRMEAKDCRFYKISRTALRAEHDTKANFENCYIEDFGYEFDGTTPTSSSPIAISFRGASEGVVRGCTVWQRTWPQGTDVQAINVALNTYDGTDYVGGNLLVDGLYVKGTYHAIVERDGVAPSYMRGVVIDDVVEPFPDNLENTPVSTVYYDIVGDTDGPFKRIGTAVETFDRTVVP